jgi:uncharacterized protein (TIGR00251 family)
MSTVLQVKARPRAATSELEHHADGTWTARLKAPPVDGKANAELIALVARHFGTPRSAVSIKSGAAGRHKWVVVDGMS